MTSALFVTADCCFVDLEVSFTVYLPFDKEVSVFQSLMCVLSEKGKIELLLSNGWTGRGH